MTNTNSKKENYILNLIFGFVFEFTMLPDSYLECVYTIEYLALKVFREE